MRERIKLQPPDFWLILSVVSLVAVGLLLVFDASYAKAADSPSMNFDPYYLVKRQARAIGIGGVCLVIASFVSFKLLRKFAVWVLAAAVGLLVVVLLPGVGHAAYGARSWLKVGMLVFQPSELAKIGLILYLAWVLSPAKTFARRAPKRWILPVAISMLLMGLVVLEHDFGTAGLLAAITLAMFFAAGARKRYLALSVAAGVLVACVVMTNVPHCMARWRAFTDPWAYRFDEGYQTVHSLAGIGTGGLHGVGLCEGRVKFYMPASSTDYIFATVVEETGLIGAAAIIAGFCLFAYRGLHIACRSKSVYGNILASGIVSMVSAQALINLAVVTKAIPATGLSLPFISYGGSGMVAMLACVGILLSVSRQVDIVGERLDSDESNSGRRRDRRSHLSRDKRGASPARSGPRGGVAVRG